MPSTPTFAEVYAQRHRDVVRTAALITGSAPVGEEIAQEVFLRLYRDWDRIQSPLGWLRVATVNACRSWQRRHILERSHARAAPLVASQPDGLAVRDALNVLNHRQRTAIVLRYFCDLREADIAEAIGCRPGTVKSLLARSLARLKEELVDRDPVA